MLTKPPPKKKQKKKLEKTFSLLKKKWNCEKSFFSGNRKTGRPGSIILNMYIRLSFATKDKAVMDRLYRWFGTKLFDCDDLLEKMSSNTLKSQNFVQNIKKKLLILAKEGCKRDCWRKRVSWVWYLYLKFLKMHFDAEFGTPAIHVRREILAILKHAKLFKKVRTKHKKKRDKSHIWLLKQNFLRKNIFRTTEKKFHNFSQKTHELMTSVQRVAEHLSKIWKLFSIGFGFFYGTVKKKWWQNKFLVLKHRLQQSEPGYPWKRHNEPNWVRFLLELVSSVHQRIRQFHKESSSLLVYRRHMMSELSLWRYDWYKTAHKISKSVTELQNLKGAYSSL